MKLLINNSVMTEIGQAGKQAVDKGRRTELSEREKKFNLDNKSFLYDARFVVFLVDTRLCFDFYNRILRLFYSSASAVEF
jgi:hypothetical protein